ncbi:unnamed protein product [Oppiella nova]|uniref:Cytochrome P450 n=1 Tax=Oppiella nova TaxID=334625 RepID=A0A7R9M8H5_9ACAR|nr:unnamed protein product [Oppiella nova]CAG2172580.1 unnamed protein product [Oppiella nova]
MFSTQFVFNYVLENALHIWGNIRERLNLPAGPVGLPVVGYSVFLGKHPHRDITKLGDKYGSVFTLQLGVNNVVVLNDWEAVRDALNKDAFLGRPFHSPFTAIAETKSLADESGEVWRDQRRSALQILRDLGFGKGSMEDRITDEISYLTKCIDETNGEPMNIHEVLVPSMSNNICHLVFGHRMDFNEPKRQLFDKQLDQAVSRISVIGVLAMSPIWFSKLFFKLGGSFNKKVFNAVISIFESEISSHRKSLDTNNKRDYIDGYLAEMEVRQRKDPNTHFTLKRLDSNARAFFGAGSETVRTTTEWLLLLSVRYSEHQKRVHSEIDSVVGRDRSPCYADRLHMPFTQAFINEVMRYKTTIPVNLMRRTTEDTSVLGHFIPKDTQVLANIWAVHNDPKVWHKPQDFNPNRFLTSDGKQVIKIDAFIPFSYGKRNCVGETLGRVEVFLYFVSLLQKYTISAANDEMLTLEERFGLSLQPKHKPILIFNNRY